MKRVILASTSTVYGSSYLEYILPELEKLFEGIKKIVFVPYARPNGVTFDEYTEVAKTAFSKIGIEVKGVHTFDSPIEAIKSAKGIFVGGGNTFLLVKTLYENKLIDLIKSVVDNGTPYFGTSAGSNIGGLTMQTTNDMPIVYPPSFDTIGLVPFNLNPHYLDPIEGSKHMGETRERRIFEFHKQNSTPVVGLREGSWLEIVGQDVFLRGELSARIFKQAETPFELDSNTNIIKYL